MISWMLAVFFVLLCRCSYLIHYIEREKTMKYRHIFLRRGYVVAVFFRRDKDIEQSRLFVCNKYDSVRIELA